MLFLLPCVIIQQLSRPVNSIFLHTIFIRVCMSLITSTSYFSTPA